MSRAGSAAHAGDYMSDDDPLLLSRLFTAIVKENGHGFGVDLFGSLPIETTNWRPDLVPEPVVKQAYWDWLEWAEQVEGSAWVDLEETLAIYELEPNPMKRAFAAFTGLPDLSNQPAIQKWLGDRDEESSGFPDHSGQAVLDWYFAPAATPSSEAPPPAAGSTWLSLVARYRTAVRSSAAST